MRLRTNYPTLHGLGVHIPPEIESLASSVFIWRQLQKPKYWTDGGFGRREKKETGYIPTIPQMQWDADSQLCAATAKHGEFWLVGKNAEELIHPCEAADFSQQWHCETRGKAAAWPGVRANETGLTWLDEFLDVGGRVPVSWHINIRGEWDKWIDAYNLFVDWMRKRRVIRPVIVSDVEADLNQRRPNELLLTKIINEVLMRDTHLSAIFWSTAYDPRRWGASMIIHSMDLSTLGKFWTRSQKEWRDANTVGGPRST